MLDKNGLGLLYLFLSWDYEAVNNLIVKNSTHDCYGDISASAEVNVALRKPTKLSSTFEQYNSTFALDGERSDRSVHGAFICAQSKSLENQQSWWVVDLKNVYVINEIDIFGRTDCCYYTLANFDVEIILPTCTCNHWNNLEEGYTVTCHYQATGSQRITVTCPPNTKGRYVRIKRRDTGYLIICELEVYGNLVNSLHESDLGSIRSIYACGQIGYGYVGPVLDSSVMKSNIQCTSMCISKTACTAAEYDKNTNVCTLKGECFNGTQSSLYTDNDKQVFFIQ